MKRTTLLLLSITLSLIISASFPTISRAETDVPDSAYIQAFYGRIQSYNLSCEVRSAADVAGFWGISVSEEELFDIMPSSDNPNEGFVGNRNGVWGRIPPSSYGVHAEPIARVLRELGLNAQARLNMTSDEIRTEVAAGKPVIVWIIGQMWTGYADRLEFQDGKQGLVAANEHTMVVTGYDSNLIQVYNPYYGTFENYTWEAFENSWQVLENMAVTTSDSEDEIAAKVELTPSPTPESWPADAVIYTVQTGDYLIELGKRYGVDWRWLVEINQIPYPWTLFPGQQIRVK